MLPLQHDQMRTEPRALHQSTTVTLFLLPGPSHQSFLFIHRLYTDGGSFHAQASSISAILHCNIVTLPADGVLNALLFCAA